MKFDKVKRFPSVKAQVRDNLRRALLEGAFDIGDHITEEKVADYLGVSRTPVREALSILAYEGILSPRDKRGYDLFKPTPQNMEETFVVRELLEPLAITNVVRESDETLQSRLRQIIETEANADRENNAREFAIQNLEFRISLYERCGNVYIQETLSKFDHCSFYMVLWSIRDRSELRQFINTNQRATLDAIERGDTAAAIASVLDYIKGGRKNITSLPAELKTEERD